MKNFAIFGYVFDPDSEDVVTCEICGAKFDKRDSHKMEDGWLCPSCYGSRKNHVNKIVWEQLDDYEIEILKTVLKEEF